MKKMLSATIVGCFLASMIAGTVQAQDPGAAIRASIPFDFIVRGKTLRAGNYEIRRINDEPVGLLVRNVDSKHDQAMVGTDAAYENQTPHKSMLLFHRYGDSYFLSEIVTAGENTGQEIVPSRAERTIRREMASNKTEPETVALAVN
jgi:hypothetical protein